VPFSNADRSLLATQVYPRQNELRCLPRSLPLLLILIQVDTSRTWAPRALRTNTCSKICQD
jgi:hypothetical protein